MHFTLCREQNEYNQDYDEEDGSREAEQQAKKELMGIIKKQFALRRGKGQASTSSGRPSTSSNRSSTSSFSSRMKEEKEKEKLEKLEQDRAKRSKLTSAQYTSKIVGLNVGVS